MCEYVSLRMCMVKRHCVTHGIYCIWIYFYSLESILNGGAKARSSLECKGKGFSVRDVVLVMWLPFCSSLWDVRTSHCVTTLKYRTFIICATVTVKIKSTYTNKISQLYSSSPGLQRNLKTRLRFWTEWPGRRKNRVKVRFHNLSLFNYDCTELCRQVSALFPLADELCCIFITLINAAFPQALYYQLHVGWKAQREGTPPRVWPVLSYAQHPAFHVSTFCFYLRAALHISWHNDQAPSHELSMRSLESARIIMCQIQAEL